MSARDELVLELPADGRTSRVQSVMPIDDLDGPDEPAELLALVEALLLVAPAPVTIDELALGAGVHSGRIEAALAELETDTTRGWVVQRHGGRVHLATAPRFAHQIRRFLGLDRETRLSGAALEALAVVAYQQPVTKADIEAVRGVDCTGVLQTLMTRGLVDQVGRQQSPGQPILYGTTADFLQHFGLRSLADLPPLGEVDGRDAALALASAVTGADIFGSEPTAAD
jgi:segregation and condensation protein B